jgi:two-component system, cell cycle sensor histidine kinase and response regulator CckA
MMLAAVLSIALVVSVAALALLWRELGRERHRADRAAQMTAQLEQANRRLEAHVAEHERTRAALAASEEQVRQAQKMEAVGRLAGGVAHDFNNILTAITAYAEFLIEAIPPNDPRGDDAREIRKAARRATTLTSQLLAFSRRQVHQPRPLLLNDVIGEFSKILGRVIGEDVRLQMHMQEKLGTVRADPSQIEQVIMNLVVNASDAMPGGGTITIATDNVEVTGVEPHARPPLRRGHYVVLRVADTGHGMDEVTMSKIFDPFFTTKETGKGTGLGLATVYAIAEQAGGAVAVHSAPRHGAEFSVYFPRIDAAAEQYASGANLQLAPRGNETVLLVEDDDAVRVLSARILERHGYNVLVARDGAHALDLARRHTSDIHLLITDVVMPNAGGVRVSDTLTAQRPDMRVIFQSGYTAGEIGRRGELDPSIAFLQKPFTSQALLHKVREVLDARAAAA